MSAMLVVLTAAAVAVGQQPNSGYAAMVVNGVYGPPWPNLVDVRTGLPSTLSFSGAGNQPFAVFQSSGLNVGAAFVPASNSLNSVDMILNPFPVIVLNGFQNPIFSTDLTGNKTFTIPIPNAGAPPSGVPLGLQVALQTMMADPFSSQGWTLTAATRVTVIQGPTVTNLNVGDEGNATVSVATMNIPFYGVNRSSLTVNANGYLTFTSSGSDFTPTASEFNSGAPRMAGFWSDMESAPVGGGIVKSTVDTNPGPGLLPYVLIEFINVEDWLTNVPHSFSMYMRTDGYLEIIHLPTNNAGTYDTITGIGPGSGLSTAGQKNFVGPEPTGSTVGSGILTTAPFAYLGAVNESFFEWWGIQTLHLYYTNPYDNPYDMPAVTLHFLPSGTGSLPGSTNRYTLY